MWNKKIIKRYNLDHQCFVSLIHEKVLVNVVQTCKNLNSMSKNNLKEALLNKIVEKKSLRYFESNMFTICSIEPKFRIVLAAKTKEIRQLWVNEICKIINSAKYERKFDRIWGLERENSEEDVSKI